MPSMWYGGCSEGGPKNQLAPRPGLGRIYHFCRLRPCPTCA
uniref:Uncharacterized protein n=1 Tax=Arundo donax TaxID=35708 RepID=A0A0A9BW47_ARUDO